MREDAFFLGDPATLLLGWSHPMIFVTLLPVGSHPIFARAFQALEDAVQNLKLQHTSSSEGADHGRLQAVKFTKSHN